MQWLIQKFYKGVHGYFEILILVLHIPWLAGYSKEYSIVHKRRMSEKEWLAPPHQSMLWECICNYVTTVGPLYKDTPEMRTSPLIRTLCMAPAT